MKFWAGIYNKRKMESISRRKRSFNNPELILGTSCLNYYTKKRKGLVWCNVKNIRYIDVIVLRTESERKLQDLLDSVVEENE